jgi:hypothetical protein
MGFGLKGFVAGNSKIPTIDVDVLPRQAAYPFRRIPADTARIRKSCIQPSTTDDSF